MNIGKSIKIALVDNDLKSKDLASKMGVSSAYLSAISTGNKQATLSVVVKISSLLGYKVSEFIALGE